MAAYNKCAGGWRVRVRKSGQCYTATFPFKVQAQEWAAAIERDIIDGKLGKIPDKTFSDLIDRYLKEVTPTKATSKNETLRLDKLKLDDIARVKLCDLSPKDFEKWRDARLKEVSDGTVDREMNTISHIGTMGVKWKWLRENPLKQVARPPEPPPRHQTISDADCERLLHVCGENYHTATGRVGLCLLFALETAMRSGEITQLTWRMVHDKHVHLPKEICKTRVARDVPLSRKAIEILDQLKGITCRDEDDRCFGITGPILDALFRKAKEKAGVADITFRDSRATALTRLAKIFLNPLELARISGHRNIALLSHCYYRPSVSDLADRLDPPTSESTPSASEP